MIYDGFKKRKKRYILTSIVLLIVLLALVIFSMCYGNTVYSIKTVVETLMGDTTSRASFTIINLRLPRMIAGVFCGFAFGIAGNTFQKLLGNPLASPDIIGVTSGSSVAAVFGILFLNLSSVSVSILSVISGLLVATIIFLLSKKGGYSNSRLILIGIGMQAFLNAMISWMILKASEYDVSGALRWLSGSLNGVGIEDVIILVLVVIPISIVIISLRDGLDVLQLGSSHALTLGLNVNINRVLMIILSQLLIAFSTVTTGPIASVAFLSGPIASKISGRGSSNMLTSGLTGAILVMGADLIGQYAFSVRYPVGVITGILGAPYLIFLLMRYSKKGV